MDEKRRSKRLELDVTIEMERQDQGNMTTVKFAHVKVTNLSSSGIGFITQYPLDKGAIYSTRIQIWTKEVIQTMIRIVRCEGSEDGLFHCGASFVGLANTEELKIRIYEMFNPDAE